MKHRILILALLLTSYCCQSQVKDYRVVFDISARDSVSQQAVIREIEIIKGGNPDAKLEVVVYGQALPLVVKDKSNYVADLQRVMAMKDVTIKVCAITMERNKVDKSRLIAGVVTVPDGIYELISKQREGWGYIKVAH